LQIKLIFLVLLLSSCANKLGTNNQGRSALNTGSCSAFKVRLAGNDVNLSYSKQLNFGPIYIGDTAYASLIFYTNDDDLKASNINGQLTAKEFRFDGAFPGISPNHGGCGYMLESNRSCKINLQFKPQDEKPYDGSFILTFEVDGKHCKQTIDLSGNGFQRL